MPGENTRFDSKHACDSEQMSAMRHGIEMGSKLTAPFLIMNFLATVVAAYGLLANSTAVVIGAMIIAMLLGPIMGLALALVDGDINLLKDAMITEMIGVVLVILVAIFIGSLHSGLPMTTEILSRTKPNLLDLMIALGGGAAGAYATLSPKVSVSLVGVAISTALVPPLTACGICLSHGMLSAASGAFVLFVTNLVAIQCAASLVLYAFGYHQLTQGKRSDPNYVRRIVVDGFILIFLAVFLYFQLRRTVEQNQFESHIREQLERSLVEIPGAYLSETRFSLRGNVRVVVAVVRVPNSVTPGQVEKIERQLGGTPNEPIELHVRSLLTKEATADGYLHVIDQVSPEQPDANAPQGP